MKNTTFITTAMAVAAASALLAVPSANAAIQIQESFNYTNGANLAGQNGGTGFSGAWAMQSNMAGTIVTGLSLGNLATSGNAASFNRTGSSDGLAHGTRLLSTGISSGTIWSSHLAKWTFDNGGDGHEAGLAIQGTSGSTGQLIRQDDLVFNSGDKFGIAYSEGDANVTARTTNTNVLDTTYLLLSRWTAADSNTGSAKLWVFDNATSVNNILGSNDESVFDANAYATATFADDGSGANPAFGAGDSLYYGGRIGGSGGNYTITVDEIRIGTMASDVLVAVPEPGSLALLLGGVGFLALRRQRRSV